MIVACKIFLLQLGNTIPSPLSLNWKTWAGKYTQATMKCLISAMNIIASYIQSNNSLELCMVQATKYSKL